LCKVVFKPLVHGIEDFGVGGRFFDEQHEVGPLKLLDADRADPFFPDIEIGYWNARHGPSAVMTIETPLPEVRQRLC
jgi:hypothetical protein